MAIISADTFRPLKRFIGCRLQQGVPIVDADWNELEDIRRFELRAFLKWFIGDGIPEGTDGFRVVGKDFANDFLISAGTPPAVVSSDPVEHALRDIGRLLVDGRDILLDADLRFRQQPLHVSQPGAAALASALGVPTVPELPGLNGDVLVYVDVWDRLLTPAEDPSILFPGLGTESCARLKREWVVRARVGTTVPRLTTPADPDYLAGHSYYAIARVTRRTSSTTVTAADVVDLRARRLFIPPASLVEDVLGTTPERYRQGLDRPALSLRDAINALLRGELPSTPDAPVTLDPGNDVARRSFAFDKSGGVLAAWQSPRVGGTQQVFISRLSLSNISAGFDAVPVQVTSGTNTHISASIAVLPNNEVLVTYSDVNGAGDQNVFYKRGTYAGLAAAPELPVAASGSLVESLPVVVVSGDIAVFIYFSQPQQQWLFRRLRHTDNTFLDASPVVLSVVQSPGDMHAAVADDGRVWVTFRTTGDDIVALVMDPVSGALISTAQFNAGTTEIQPFILPTKSGQVFLFWQFASGLAMSRFASGTWDPVLTLPFSVANDRNPAAVEDPYGGVWLYFSRGTPGRLQFVRREPAGGTWGVMRQLTVPPSSGNADTNPFALQAQDRSTWVFWQSDRGSGAGGTSNQNIFFKQLINNI